MIAPETASPHEASLAVWDLASPVVVGRPTTLKIGIACPSGCSLSGTTIDIRDEKGATIASGRAGSEPWPDTLALYWVELDVAAPETEGTHALRIHAASQDSVHPPLESIVRLVTSRPPEHRVTFEVIERGRGIPLGGVELRVGAFRAATSDAGLAYVDVPGGTYEVCAWKIGHDLLSTTTHVAGDTTIRLEVVVTPESEQPYWM
jgi:hypothetical protein